MEFEAIPIIEVGLGNYLFDDPSTLYAGELEIQALEAVSEAFVVDAELVKHGGVKVVDGDSIVGDCVAEFVGGSIGRAALDSCTGHPE